MMIGISILFVSVFLVIASHVYKKMFPEIKIVSTDLVLIPFRFILNIVYHCH